VLMLSLRVDVPKKSLTIGLCFGTAPRCDGSAWRPH
jgi:hypothetical protein